jgi:hypothetical protein
LGSWQAKVNPMGSLPQVRKREVGVGNNMMNRVKHQEESYKINDRLAEI